MNIIESDLCGAMKPDGRYCNNRTRHPSGFCPAHRRAPLHGPARAKSKPKLEIFTVTHRAQGREETPINSKSVTLRHGDSELIVSWCSVMKAFEIRTMNKKLRDGMTIIPECSNVVLVKVGER